MDFKGLIETLEESEPLSDFVRVCGEADANCLCINGYVALPIGSLAPHIDSDEDIELLDDQGMCMGFLCLTKRLNDVDFPSITTAQHVAYLTEIEPQELYISPYFFRNDYVVVDIYHLEQYRSEYMVTSSVWGGFQEKCDTTYSPYKRKVQQIRARSGLKFPTESHKVIAVTSTLDHFSLERFLKLYHILELGFDWEIVNQIKALGDDLKGIGKILSSYGRDDIELLKKIVNKCNNIAGLESVLNVVFEEGVFDKAYEIFFDYEKESTPFKGEKKDKFLEMKEKGLLFSAENAKAVGLAGRQDLYEGLLKNVAAYWIYRTRCGITHHRIGEYIITLEDEPFIVDFMEPVIKEVICQVCRA